MNFEDYPGLKSPLSKGTDFDPLPTPVFPPRQRRPKGTTYPATVLTKEPKPDDKPKEQK